jgi:hypothetical protein
MASDNVFVPDQGALSDLADWIAGDLGSGVARLYVSNTPYSKTRVCGDYTEASWAGYVPATPLAWGVPFINTDGKAETDSASFTYHYTVGSGSAFAFGIYVTDPGQTKLLIVVPFINPVKFTPAQPDFPSILQVTAISQL